MTKDIMLVGVGGQGVVLASNLLARAFLEAGYHVKQSEIHGMAQRGGSVTSFVRRGGSAGELVYAPGIDPGQADALLAFEKLEAIRFSNYLKPGGLLVSSQQEIIPTTVSALGAPYPDSLDRLLDETGARVFLVDVLAIARECGNPRVVNVALVGALAAHLEIATDIWERAIKATVPRALEANLAAFRMGMEAV
ncbi:MAG: indolepyruvate oxidoreductase subunit beta [Bacillota bacterium]|nr:indolepyruvate oxidoreductase subunit beta [Bacillota bacterium]